MTKTVADTRIDEAKIFCPRAVPRLELATRADVSHRVRELAWAEAYAVAFEGLVTRDKALQSLTPGGSEYVNDPERCANIAKEQMRRGQEAFITLIRARHTITELVAALRDLTDTYSRATGDGGSPVVKHALAAIRRGDAAVFGPITDATVSCPNAADSRCAFHDPMVVT